MAKTKKRFIKNTIWESGCLLDRILFVFYIIVPILIMIDLWNPTRISLFDKIWDSIFVIVLTFYAFNNKMIVKYGKRKTYYEEV